MNVEAVCVAGETLFCIIKDYFPPLSMLKLLVEGVSLSAKDSILAGGKSMYMSMSTFITSDD